jgi:hypothetical protein
VISGQELGLAYQGRELSELPNCMTRSPKFASEIAKLGERDRQTIGTPVAISLGVVSL